jgi:hypothetical protein
MTNTWNDSKIENYQRKQSEITVTMTTGKFAKNEVTVKWMGRDEASGSESFADVVSLILEKMEAKNPSKVKD